MTPTPLHWAAMRVADADLAYEQHEARGVAGGWTPEERARLYSALQDAREGYGRELRAAAQPEAGP